MSKPKKHPRGASGVISSPTAPTPAPKNRSVKVAPADALAFIEEPANDRKANKGGRPALDASEKKSRSFNIKTSGQEAARIEEKAAKAGMAPSTYIREAALRRRVVVRKREAPAQADIDLVMQAIRIGTNLNQAVYRMQATKGFVPRDLMTAVNRVNDWLDKIDQLKAKGKS